MTELPPLFTLSEVAEATKYSVRHVERVLRRTPEIRPVGNGRGTRLTFEDYQALIDAVEGRFNARRRINEAGRQLSKSFRHDEQRVYFILSGSGHIKIGIAHNPHGRLLELQSGSPYPLTMLGTIPGGREKERALHREFKAHHTKGEWFRSAPAVVSRIRELLA